MPMFGQRREKLALSGGKRAAALGDRLVVASRKLCDKVIGIDNFRGAFCILQRDIFIAKCEIALDVSGKEEYVLLYLPDRSPEHIGVNVFNIYAVNEDTPLLNIKVSSDQI